MLKKSSLLLLFLSPFAASLFAQPVLQNTVVPNIGDKVTITTADTVNANPGNAGANQTWNFSAWHILSGTTPVQHQYISPTGTPYAANFPNATLVIKVLEDTIVYAYFREQSDKFSALGSASLAFQQKYIDADDQLKFPTNYNGSYSDNFEYTTDAGTGVVFDSKGSRTTTYDAYGTLTTPLGNFSNAIRIKSVSTQMDVAEFSGIKIENETSTTTYDWLVANHPGALASIFYVSTVTKTIIPGFDTLIAISPVAKTANFVSAASTVGLTELSSQVNGISDLTLGPNPATDQLTLRFVSEQAIPTLQIKVMDVNGKVMLEQSAPAASGLNNQAVPVTPLAPGLYYLSITDGVGIQTLPWVKQ